MRLYESAVDGENVIMLHESGIKSEWNDTNIILKKTTWKIFFSFLLFSDWNFDWDTKRTPKIFTQLKKS